MVIADVSGHNVGASLIMTETRTFIHARLESFHSAAETAAALNSFLYEDLTRAELFITMFYLKYHAASRELSFANAGHNPPLIWRAQSRSLEFLDAEGLILGVFPKVDFEEKRVRLHPGDLLLLYTDGIIEAENSEGSFFGESRLVALLEEHHDLSPQEIIDTLLSRVRLFIGTTAFNDDVSLVAIRVLR
jgi:serine phosphatase RsbU (regulator of sigma subunit)